MNTVLIIAAIVIGIFIVFRLLKRGASKIASSVSVKSWSNLEKDHEARDMFANTFRIENFDIVIRDILMPAKLNYLKFNSNLLYLMKGGNPPGIFESDNQKYFSLRTPSITKYEKPFERPVGLPIWFIAAFPDIVEWINSGEIDRSMILYEGLSEDFVNTAFDKQKDSIEMIQVYSHMVRNYLNKVSPILEVQ